MTPALRIAAKRDGFRRAGIAHPAVATDHPAGRFTPDQVEALRADPMLVVELVAEETQAATGAVYTPASDGAANAVPANGVYAPAPGGDVETAPADAVKADASPTAGDHGGEVAGTHAEGEEGAKLPPLAQEAEPASAPAAQPATEADGVVATPAGQAATPGAEATGAAGAPTGGKPKTLKKKA